MKIILTIFLVLIFGANSLAVDLNPPKNLRIIENDTGTDEVEKTPVKDESTQPVEDEKKEVIDDEDSHL